MPETVFLLSPAHCGGKRAQLLFNQKAEFPLAVRLREETAPLGDVFGFLSGLYFRGKFAYAQTFGADVLVITPGHGLLPASRPVSLADLHAIADVGVSPKEPRFREPLERDAARLGRRLGRSGVAVLLGSIATDKYVGILGEHLGARLRFPSAFVGRGDMSRGGLMLRCVRERRELVYEPVAGAVRHGRRPPKLLRIRA